jgi:hypothetical protein
VPSSEHRTYLHVVLPTSRPRIMRLSGRRDGRNGRRSRSRRDDGRSTWRA